MSKQMLHLYHINDLHSHLEQWPKIMAFLKDRQRLHDDNDETYIRFDIGDHADRFHPITEGTSGKGNVQLMNEADLLNTTIGNNEGITFSKDQLDHLYDEANFQVLVANLKEKDGRLPKWAKLYDIHILENGLKVGVIGVTAPYKAYYEQLGWKIEDPYEAIETTIGKIRSQVDILILLSHLGLEADKQISVEMKEIDIILGAHTHHVLPNGLHTNDTTIGQAGKFGFYIGHMKIVWDEKQRRIEHVKADCIDLQEYESDEESEQLLSRLSEQTNENLSEVVTVLSQPLDLEWFGSSAFTSLLAETIREWCDSEISMVNAGLLLEPLKEGPVTKGDLHRVCPHPINPCKIMLKGEYLKELIHHAMTKELESLEVKGLGFRGKVMGRMVFDGVEIEGEELEDGEYHVQKITINGEPIAPEKVYSIGAIDMFTFGRLLPSVHYAEEKVYYLPEMLRDVLAWRLKNF